MAALTLSAILGAVAALFTAVLNAILGVVKHFGYPPLALFLMGLLFLDMQGNTIGGVISAVTQNFYGFSLSTFTLFMFVTATLVIWFWYKVRQFHGTSIFGG